jgi:hypothetical protein
MKRLILMVMALLMMASYSSATLPNQPYAYFTDTTTAGFTLVMADTSIVKDTVYAWQIYVSTEKELPPPNKVATLLSTDVTNPDTLIIDSLVYNTEYYVSVYEIARDTSSGLTHMIWSKQISVKTLPISITPTEITDSTGWNHFSLNVKFINDAGFTELMTRYRVLGASSWTSGGIDTTILVTSDTISTYGLIGATIYEVEVAGYYTTSATKMVAYSSIIEITTANPNNYPADFDYDQGEINPHEWHYSISWTNLQLDHSFPRIRNDMKSINVAYQQGGIDSKHPADTTFAWLCTEQQGATVRVLKLYSVLDTVTNPCVWVMMNPYTSSDSTYIKTKAWGTTFWLEIANKDSTHAYGLSPDKKFMDPHYASFRIKAQY